MRVIGRRMSGVLVAAGSDKIIAGYPIPAGGVLNNVWLDVKLMTYAAGFLDSALLYGITGFVVPLLDPDTVQTYDDVWDSQIPKDAANAAGVFDLDTSAVDTQPEWEVGEPDWTGVFNLAAGAPVEIFKRRKLVSFADVHSKGFESGTPDTFYATDLFNTQVSRTVRVDTPSLVLFGFSSPTIVSSATVWSTLSEIEWVMYQYLEMTLEHAWMNLVGLVEAGAETPYVEAASLITELIEDVVLESEAASIGQTSWNVWCTSTFDVSVPGRLTAGVISSD